MAAVSDHAIREQAAAHTQNGGRGHTLSRALSHSLSLTHCLSRSLSRSLTLSPARAGCGTLPWGQRSLVSRGRLRRPEGAGGGERLAPIGARASSHLLRFHVRLIFLSSHYSSDPCLGGGVRIHPGNARLSGRHGVQYVAQCVACAALTLVVWQ